MNASRNFGSIFFTFAKAFLSNITAWISSMAKIFHEIRVGIIWEIKNFGF